VFFLFLTILLDLLNNLGRYLDRADAQGMGVLELLWFLAGYYGKGLPFSFVTIAPFVTVIGAMFAITRLMAQNELQPILFVGRSMMRVLYPCLLGGVVAALGMVACWQWVVPAIAGDVTAAQSFLAGSDRAIKNVVLERRHDGFTGLRVREYDAHSQRLTGVSLLREGQMPGDALLIVADSADWDPAIGDWRLANGWRETAGGGGPCQILGAPEWPPEQILQSGQENVDCELFSYDELLATRESRPNRRDVAMALHRHITYPLANVILLLLALPFAIHFERGSRIERVLGAIGICAAYLLVDLTCQNLGHNGWVQPLVAAWSPTILFGSIGIVMFTGMRT
jgi:lipopolysaccharide export system permease protein